MKTYILLGFKFLILLFLTNSTNAQILKNLDKRIERKIERAVDRKIDRHIDKTINSADKKSDEAIKKGKKTVVTGNDKTSSKNSRTGSLEENDIEESGENEVNFVRGNRIIFNDNFDKDAIGDFPAKWNSTKGGEVKKLSGFANKFLKIPADAIVSVELKKVLPENFTLEFDMIIPSDINYRMAGFGFGNKPQGISYLLSSRSGYHFSFHNIENQPAFTGLKYGTYNIGTSLQKIDYKAHLNKVIKVQMIANGKRIRMYVDGRKMVDETSNFAPDFRKAFYFSASTHGQKETKLNYFYISNVVLAESSMDERSQVLKELLENGEFTTNDILFATNSDKIQASSNEIISQIVDAMKQSSDLKLKIIGHTDSDGDDNANMTLSKKRANAVKMKMVSLGISPSRLQTDGKGESEPIESNDDNAGKAKNRRVVFIKTN